MSTYVDFHNSQDHTHISLQTLHSLFNILLYVVINKHNLNKIYVFVAYLLALLLLSSHIFR